MKKISMSILDQLKNLLGEVLQLGDRAQALHAHSPLLGHIPELDSMAVVSVITSIEQHFSIHIDDEDINAETFASLGNLAEFISKKLAREDIKTSTWMD